MVVSHILIPYNGQEYADRAFDEGLNIAKKHGSRISVLSCFGDKWHTLHIADVIIEDSDFNKKIQKLKDKALDEQIDVDFHGVHTDLIVAIIQSFALENDVDMIIMGTSNRKGFKKLLHGSISKEINECVHCIVKLVS